MRITVEGKGSISELNLKTPNGILYFPCSLQAGQFLVYDFDGTTYITDQNYNTIKEVIPQGVSLLNEGPSAVSFTCEVKPEGVKQPEVSVRFFTRGSPETVGSK